jgi:tetratricopeptide (TPR) repeat protein
MTIATRNSSDRSGWALFERPARAVAAAVRLSAGLAFLVQANPALAGAVEKEFIAYVRSGFEQAEKRYEARPLDNEAAWQFARACFDLAEIATNRTERAAIAERGISVSRDLVARAPNLVPAHYYLGMNLAQLAQTEGLGALKLVKQMEHEFALTSKLDAEFDYAGADRNLGLLYRDAPSIVSIGSRSKARLHLQRAVKLAPEYPENLLNLAESYLKWGDRDAARSQLKALDELWPSARKKLVGVAWASSWADWEARLQKLKSKLEG